MYRKYAELINHSHAGLLVCDEGHRLKSSTGNATINCLLQFPLKRRVLISGTPIQNDMEVLNMNCLLSIGIICSIRVCKSRYIQFISIISTIIC